MTELVAVPEDFETALAIVAHPDDLEYGMASAIARWTSQGKSVHYVLATSGEAGIDGLEPARAAPLRENEEHASAAIVGVSSVSFLGFADGLIEANVALRRAIARSIRQTRPDIVVTMNFDLTWGGSSINHADHRALGLSVVDAVRDAANRWLFVEDGEPWQGVRAIYIAGASEPSHYIDVTATIDLGIASLEAHAAYIAGLGRNFEPGEFLRNMAEFGGAAAGCPDAVLVKKFDV